MSWRANVHYIDGLTEDYSNSIANALESLQSCARAGRGLKQLFDNIIE